MPLREATMVEPPLSLAISSVMVALSVPSIPAFWSVQARNVLSCSQLSTVPLESEPEVTVARTQ